MEQFGRFLFNPFCSIQGLEQKGPLDLLYDFLKVNPFIWNFEIDRPFSSMEGC